MNLPLAESGYYHTRIEDLSLKRNISNNAVNRLVSRPDTTRQQVREYAAAVLLVGAAVALAAAIRPLFGGRIPQTIFTIAVFAAATYGGLLPGLLATALSTAAIGGLFPDAVFSIVPIQSNLVTFAVLGVLISVVLDQFRRSSAALRRSKERLEQANAELSRRSDALALSNEELRRFAYALSHDLQNPLRTVSIFTEHFAQQNKGKMDEASAQSVRYIVEAVDRMQAMVRGLLEYSTAMHHHESGQEVADGNAVVQLVLEDLRIAIEESSARVTYDPLPEVGLGPGPLHQLLLNLVSNGIKYCDQGRPEVHLSAKRDGHQWLFSVCDNGIGIDMQYSEKIFGVFERLHGSAKYGGSGIGLAICRAIVQRRSGRIWVESTPGQGSTFYFTVPAATQRDLANEI